MKAVEDRGVHVRQQRAPHRRDRRREHQFIAHKIILQRRLPDQRRRIASDARHIGRSRQQEIAHLPPRDIKPIVTAVTNCTAEPGSAWDKFFKPEASVELGTITKSSNSCVVPTLVVSRLEHPVPFVG